MATSDTITQYFVNILQRDPSASELSSWVATVDSGAVTLAQAEAAIAGSTEAVTYVDQIIRIYQAAFNRVPDVTGINGWVDELRADPTALYTVADGFTKSAEFANLYGSDAVTPSLLTAFYENILGRTPTGAEVDAWIATGQTASQILIGFSNSAEFQANSAAAVMQLKLDAGNVATADLATVYNGTDPLSGIFPGEDYALTINQDTLTGTSGNDTFTAGAAQDGSGNLTDTLQSVDSIDGGAGTDTLNWTEVDGNTVTPSLTSVENIQVRFTNGGALDLTSSTGVEKLMVANSSDNGAFIGVGAVNTFSISNDVGGNSVDFEDGTATDLNLTVSNYGSIANGNKADVTFADNDAESLTLTASNSNVEVAVNGGDAAVESVVLSVTGDNEIDLSDGDIVGAAKTLTISGSGSVDLLNAGWSAVETVNAATNSGGVEGLTIGTTATSVTLGSGSDEVTFGADVAATAVVDLGAGDDAIDVSGVDILAGAAINGGDGFDALGIEHAEWATFEAYTAAQRALITNIEGLSITDALADTDTVDLDAIASLTSFETVGVAAGGTATVSGVASGELVSMEGDLNANDGALVVEVTDAATGTEDLINLEVESSDLNGANTITVDLSDIETVNAQFIDGDGSNDDGYVFAMTNDEIVTLNLSGDQAVSFTSAGTQADLAAVNASANTAGVTLDVRATSGVTVTGSAEDDTITTGNMSMITGGEGTDDFVIVAPTNGNSYSTITDLAVDETVTMGANGTATFTDAKIELANTAVFQDYLDAATAGDGSINSALAWFQWDGDTYLVADNTDIATFSNGADAVVKLTGLLDLSEGNVTGAGVYDYQIA